MNKLLKEAIGYDMEKHAEIFIQKAVNDPRFKMDIRLTPFSAQVYKEDKYGHAIIFFDYDSEDHKMWFLTNDAIEYYVKECNGKQCCHANEYGDKEHQEDLSQEEFWDIYSDWRIKTCKV